MDEKTTGSAGTSVPNEGNFVLNVKSKTPYVNSKFYKNHKIQSKTPAIQTFPSQIQRPEHDSCFRDNFMAFFWTCIS